MVESFGVCASQYLTVSQQCCLALNMIMRALTSRSTKRDEANATMLLLRYKRYSNRLKSNKGTRTADLFVPLKLEVFLRGKIKIIIKQERDMPADHGGPLFHRSVQIYDAPFSSRMEEKHEFPFRIYFPETGAGEPLPSSFSHAFQEFPDTISLTVLYRLGVKVSIPGIDIKTVVPEHDKQPEIRYDLPRLPLTCLNTNIQAHKQKSVVQTNLLLPENERPQGWQQKLKAVFEESPRLSCEISCTELQHMWAGYRPSFTVAIRRSEEESSALSFPEAFLTSFRADLIAYTWCDASKRLKGPFERIDLRTVQKLECRTTLPVPLTKATDYAINLTTDEVRRWPSGFKGRLLVRRYFLKIRLKMKVAQRSVSFLREFEVKIVPRPEDMDDGLVEAGPSNASPPPPYSGADTNHRLI